MIWCGECGYKGKGLYLENEVYCPYCKATGNDIVILPTDSNIRNLTGEETDIYNNRLESEAKDTGVNTMDGDTEELNKRINDAFTELDAQRNRMGGLTKENYELKREIIRLTDEVHNLKIFLALFFIIAVGIWAIQ